MIALSAYKHEHGRYPASLSDLTPHFIDAVPLDAIGNAPLEYASDGATYRLAPARPVPPEVAQWNAWGEYEFPIRERTFQPKR